MILQPSVAGSFYPATRKELQSLLKSFEKELPSPLEGEPIGLLLPHAGFVYSGVVASLGYRALRDAFDLVIVAGPSHYVPFRGVSIFTGESVMTPLGPITVDQEAARFLMDINSNIVEFLPAFDHEHSVEVHLPMIQTYQPGAKVVPLIMGQGVEQSVKPLAGALLALSKKKKFLFIASSDLSHYPDYSTAVKADHEFLTALLTGDEKKVDQTDAGIMDRGYSDYHCTHCGREPLSTLLRYAHGMKSSHIKLLDYRNSGDVTGDHSRVVGYSAVAFSR